MSDLLGVQPFEALAQAVLKMCPHRLLGAGRVARPQGGDDFPVFLDRGVGLRTRNGAAETAMELDLVLHALDHLDQTRVLRRLDERAMELPAEPQPLRRVLLSKPWVGAI